MVGINFTKDYLPALLSHKFIGLNFYGLPKFIVKVLAGYGSEPLFV